MVGIDRRALYNEFQKAFPIDYLKVMPLEKYTNLNRDDSFCYWLESKTTPLGSFWGGSSYKFGIYRYSNPPKEGDPRIQFDDQYVWYTKYKKSTALEAYEVVRSALVAIAEYANKGDFESIDAIDTFGDSFKWKVAFLYSNESLVPIYKRDLLYNFAEELGMDPKVKNISEVQRFLMSKKGDKDLFEFSDELFSILKKMNKPEADDPEEDGKKYWVFSPGENASKWQECQKENIICIGWDELGDLKQYSTIDEVRTKLQEYNNKPDSSFKNDRLALWEFCNVMRPGDIVFVKQGLSKILGRGIVTGGYQFDDSRKDFKSIRTVKWTHIGSWEAPAHSIPMKTLTDFTKYPDDLKKIESLFEPVTEKQYWWLVANPKYWSLVDTKIDEVQDYTLYNENGNQRRVFQNFLNAKAGDVIIGYQATPTKQIVALLEIARGNDGERIWFKKTEALGTPIDYATIKAIPELQKAEFFVNPNGSLFKLTKDEYDIVMELIREENPIKPVVPVTKYTKEDFLKEVFVSGDDYETLKSLLLRKKNLILQGAPGVGKTFAAKRLAYAIMGEVDEDCVEQVQFHQNYSYEDFMMGYKPNETGGFNMQTGIFYNFCRRAAADRDKPYFFIIDEINRGNLSKIFGELLMLIENDYRDKQIKLSYRDEKFAVPSNLHIIGMMNTADRSLAMIDYALRRRFSFFEMKPGFESKGFKDYLEGIGSTQLESVIDAVVELNKDIREDASLGSGFCIGHSYFCNLKTVTYELLKDILEYDIIPMLREYWFDSDEKYESEAQKLRDSLK